MTAETERERERDVLFLVKEMGEPHIRDRGQLPHASGGPPSVLAQNIFSIGWRTLGSFCLSVTLHFLLQFE